MRIEIEQLRSLYREFALSHGADEEEVDFFTHTILRADLRGHSTQGLGLLPYIDELLQEQVMSFGKPFEVMQEHAATALVNGHSGVGNVVATRSMALAIQKANATGVGLVSAQNSGDFGMASNYAIQALEAGMIGISMCTGPLLVAPWGGSEPYFCTNPLAIAVPAGDQDPIVIDMATSAASMGNVVLAARDGQKLSSKAVVDAQGNYTDEPLQVILDVMDRESKMTGALLPAGPKGFGMILMVELLAGLLSGVRTWENEVPATTEQRPSFHAQTFIAISVEKFQDPAVFAASADRMIQTLKSALPAVGFDRVRLPGGVSAEKLRDNLEHGVLVRDEEWQMALQVAQRLKLSIA
jgi:LDH2 family malate/lactate/ureidoglycolate dehydrogenase